MNATYSGWRGSFMVAINQLLCLDQYFSVGGALRHIEFDPTPGTLNCADFPASVSTADPVPAPPGRDRHRPTRETRAEKPPGRRGRCGIRAWSLGRSRLLPRQMRPGFLGRQPATEGLRSQ